MVAGVDESVFVTLHFSNNRVAQFSSSIRLNLSQGARIVGSKGRLEVSRNTICDDKKFAFAKDSI